MFALDREQDYFFDLFGYVVVEGVLGADEVAPLVDLVTPMARAALTEQMFSWAEFLGWDPRVLALVDDRRMLGVVLDLCGEKARLDSAMALQNVRETVPLAIHRSVPETSRDFMDVAYTDDWRLPRSASVVVQWALTDSPPDAGGLCCIPASHRARMPLPTSTEPTSTNRLIQQIPYRAGDVVIFTEALLHGTLPWTADHQRLSFALKYCAGNQLFNDHEPLAKLAASLPLSDAQRRLLTPPFVAGRPDVLPQRRLGRAVAARRTERRAVRG